jgi:MFS family permease
VAFSDLTLRARSFGFVSAAAGVGAAAGPLIGGLITSTISWRASFAAQVLIVVVILAISRGVPAPGIDGPKPSFDVEGSVLSALGLVLVVLGVLQSGTYG